jgi:hypothetical protein
MAPPYVVGLGVAPSHDVTRFGFHDDPIPGPALARGCTSPGMGWDCDLERDVLSLRHSDGGILSSGSAISLAQYGGCVN